MDATTRTFPQPARRVRTDAQFGAAQAERSAERRSPPPLRCNTLHLVVATHYVVATGALCERAQMQRVARVVLDREDQQRRQIQHLRHLRTCTSPPAAHRALQATLADSAQQRAHAMAVRVRVCKHACVRAGAREYSGALSLLEKVREVGVRLARCLPPSHQK